MAKKHSSHQPADTLTAADDSQVKSDPHYISKSQAKRNVEALQNLGVKLVELAPQTLKKFDLDERLLEAILFAQTINSNSAKRRQYQLIGKLMRHVDAEAIQTQFERYQNQHQQKTDKFHYLESWRDRLLAEGYPAINKLMQEFPKADRSRLRQLVRNAKKEMEHNKPPKSARQIFQYLKEIIQE
jgi:ribosome-associated protein